MVRLQGELRVPLTIMKAPEDGLEFARSSCSTSALGVGTQQREVHREGSQLPKQGEKLHCSYGIYRSVVSSFLYYIVLSMHKAQTLQQSLAGGCSSHSPDMMPANHIDGG